MLASSIVQGSQLFPASTCETRDMEVSTRQTSELDYEPRDVKGFFNVLEQRLDENVARHVFLVFRHE